MTIRLPYGGNIGAGPFHSQSMEAWFCHVPGLKIVIPATPEDAKGLLLSAIEDPNPVLYFEHKYLYRSLRGRVPDAYYHTPIGKARIAREGTDLSIITYGLGVSWALEEAAGREKEGISIEVLDLRTLIPWDKETVLDSVRKTNLLVILHEAARTGGFGGELVSEIVEAAFHSLDAPPMRLGAEDTPIPFVRSLEQNVYSARAKLHAAVEKLLLY